MRIAITGANGQVGTALQKTLSQHDLILLNQPEFDLTDVTWVDRLAAMQPELVIHTAAMTDVEGAARNPTLAMQVNAFGTQNVALACLRCGAAMLYYSTNEVFDGDKGEPYFEFDHPNPVNPYAQSKWAGEQIAARLLQQLYVVRVAWVFAPGGNNFPAKIMRAADRLGALNVVDDEVAAPTYAPDLAIATARLIDTGHYGVYHLTNAEICSRYEFARAILAESGRSHIPIKPIPSSEYQRLSRPPLYTPLHNSMAAGLGIEMRSWQAALSDYLAIEMANER